MNILYRHINMRLSMVCSLMACLAVCAGCSSDDPRVDMDDLKSSLRFVVNAGGTRTSYDDGVKSFFEKGERVACFIARKESDGSYSDPRLSLWHYHKNDKDAVLVLDSLFLTVKKEWPWGGEYNEEGMFFYTNEANDLITRSPLEEPESGFVELLKPDGFDYAFFFFYPYISGAMIRENLIYTIQSYNDSKIFYESLNYPNCATNEGLIYKDINKNNQTVDEYNPEGFIQTFYFVGDTRASGSINNKNIPIFGWTKTPCFVNRVQRYKQQFDNSDFLWVSYIVDQKGNGNINMSTATYPVDLIFKKKIATIEVDCDVEISDVYFQSEKGIRQGTSINLETGKRMDYTYPAGENETWRWQTLHDNVITTEKFLPHVMDESFSRYRLMLPPQEGFDCDLYFTLNDKQYSIALEKHFSTLEEGKLYIIKINKAGKCTLKIEDWGHGKFETLTPVD